MKLWKSINWQTESRYQKYNIHRVRVQTRCGLVTGFIHCRFYTLMCVCNKLFFRTLMFSSWTMCLSSSWSRVNKPGEKTQNTRQSWEKCVHAPWCFLAGGMTDCSVSGCSGTVAAVVWVLPGARACVMIVSSITLGGCLDKGHVSNNQMWVCIHTHTANTPKKKSFIYEPKWRLNVEPSS